MIFGIMIGFFIAIAVYAIFRKKMIIGEAFVFNCLGCGKSTSVVGRTYYLHEVDNAEPIEIDCMHCGKKNIGSHLLWDATKNEKVEI